MSVQTAVKAKKPKKDKSFYFMASYSYTLVPTSGQAYVQCVGSVRFYRNTPYINNATEYEQVHNACLEFAANLHAAEGTVSHLNITYLQMIGDPKGVEVVEDTMAGEQHEAT